MRLLAILFASLALTSVAAQDSFCVKYAKAISQKTTITGADEFNLLNAVVGRVVVGCNDNLAAAFGVPGVNGTIFAPYSPSKCNAPAATGITSVNGLVADIKNQPFFLGTAPKYDSVTGFQDLNAAATPPVPLSPSIVFVKVNGTVVTPTAATTGVPGTKEGLITHLITYFGAALKCSFINTNANTPANGSFIGKYNGAQSMALVHKGMNITKDVWDEFIGSFANALTSFGVTQDDIKTTVLPIVNSFLLQPPGGPTDQIICNDKNTCACITGYTNVGGVCVAPTNPPKNQATMMTMSPLVALATIGLIASSLL